MVIGVSFWPYDQESIDERESDCEFYPDQCKNEEWFRREVNTQLQEKFHLEKNFTFAFIDSYSQTKPNIEDRVQQKHYRKETKVLWEETINRNSSFVFKGIDDVLECRDERKDKVARRGDNQQPYSTH